MKRFVFLLTLTVFSLCMSAQTQVQARKILDKTASIVGRKGGASASFTIKGKHGNASGRISIKGNKFTARTSDAIVWFDGKTQWTYMKSSQEVNVSNPTEAQQQAMNPYKFITLYKNGFNLSMKNVASGWQIHLVATNKSRSIKEMYITVGKDYLPKEVKMLQSSGWTTVAISGFKASNISDSAFRFNAREFPHAEIIDLR
ncbi:cell envelope biogenesis protein LolA [Prevotella sp. PCHR]|uniref:Cell envelope biogenesis protein LolA n=1 Tax=Xylanibacter caecicola TaxID=2736294 RepID=A0ABX2B322_9BACT|nr:LolA-like putative outer membrane lipoprotein chaperone [Xylanibacter caecicola]NPE25811.1 cell envelope biogenesis protein LolA [Xylanibacter caecicola]